MTTCRSTARAARPTVPGMARRGRRSTDVDDSAPVFLFSPREFTHAFRALCGRRVLPVGRCGFDERCGFLQPRLVLCPEVLQARLLQEGPLLQAQVLQAGLLQAEVLRQVVRPLLQAEMLQAQVLRAEVLPEEVLP